MIRGHAIESLNLIEGDAEEKASFKEQFEAIPEREIITENLKLGLTTSREDVKKVIVRLCKILQIGSP